jgi:hypothetical protein
MPSFRDLKGRPVDDVVDSRQVPGLPDAGQLLVEREAVRQAVEQVQSRKSEREVLPFPDQSPVPRPDLPTDLEALLQDLTSTSTALHMAVTDGVQRMQELVRAIRARVEKDAGKLARVNALLKALDESGDRV